MRAARRGGKTWYSRLVLCAERGLVSGRSTGHAQPNFMSLSNSQRSRRNGSFERGLFRCISVANIAIVQHTPLFNLRDDHVFGQSHDVLLAPVAPFNDAHSIMAAMCAAVRAAVMFAICELRSCGAKIAVPINVPVSANANPQLF